MNATSDTQIIQNTLTTLLKATGITLNDQGEGTFKIGTTLFNITKSSDSTGSAFVITPESDFTASDLLKLVFDTNNIFIIQKLCQDVLGNIKFTSFTLTLPDNSDDNDIYLGPELTIEVSIPHNYTMLDQKISINPDWNIDFTFYQSFSGTQVFTNYGINITGSAVIFQHTLNVSLIANNATTWQISFTDQNGVQLPGIDTLGKEIGINSLQNLIDQGTHIFGMSGLSINAMSISVDFSKLKIENVTLTGKLNLGPSASLSLTVDAASRLITGELTKESTIPLSSFINESSDDFNINFPDFSFSINLSDKTFQCFGEVNLSGSNDVLTKILKALSLQNESLALSLGVATSPLDVLLKADVVNDQNQEAVVSISTLADSLSGSSDILKGSPLENLGIQYPSIQITKSSGQFSIQLLSAVLDTSDQTPYGTMLLIAEDASSPSGGGLGFGIGIDCNPSKVLANILKNVKIPDYMEFSDLYLVFSTINQQFTFPVMQNNTPCQVTVQKDSFGLGGTVQLNGKPGNFLKDLLGNGINMFISGMINFSQFSIKLTAGIDTENSNIGLNFNSSKNHKYPSIGLKDINIQLVITDDNLQASLTCQFVIQIHTTTFYPAGSLIIQENEFDVSASITGDAISLPLIDGYELEVNSLAVEIGDSYELEEPAIGMTGEVTLGNYNAFFAFLFDSAEPQNIMLAASINALPSLDLLKLLTSLCANYDKSLSFLKALQSFNISGTPAGSLAATPAIINELNTSKTCPEVAGTIPIAEGKNQYLITQGKKDSNVWFITDNTTANIYQVTYDQNANKLNITKELSFYMVPTGTVYISPQISFPEGFRFNGQITVFGFTALADVVISTSGFSVKAACSPVSFGPQINGNPAITFVNPNADKDNPGPVLSIDTISNPHFQVQALLRVLGVSDNVNINIDENGLTIQNAFSTGLNFFSSSLSLTSEKWQNLNFTGSVNLSPSVNFKSDVTVSGITIIPAGNYGSFSLSGSIAINISSSDHSCIVSGSLTWSGKTIYAFNNVSITVDDLHNLEKCVANWIESNVDSVFDSIKHDASVLVNLVKNDVIDLGNNVGKALRYAYGIADPDAVSQDLKTIWGETQNGVNTIVSNMKIANFTDPQIASSLSFLNVPVNIAGDAIKTILKITDPTTLSNLLINGGFHDVESAINTIFGCTCVVKVHVGPACVEDGKCTAKLGPACIKHGDCGAHAGPVCIAHGKCPIKF